MTFSDASVAKAVNRDFVCAWMNKAPNAKYKDGMYEHIKVPRGLPLGTGVTNVTAIFATADGTVIHAMPGYLGPTEFLRHLEFAKSLFAKVFDSKIPREDRARVYADAHLEAVKGTVADLEKESHKLLSTRYMRVDEFPRGFFHGLERGG